MNNELGAIQRAELFADVDKLKAEVATLNTSLANVIKGCNALVEMDSKLLKGRNRAWIAVTLDTLDTVDGPVVAATN